MSKFISIEFSPDDLTDEAIRLLQIAENQSWWTGLHRLASGQWSTDVIDYDSLGSNDTLAIRVKSNIPFAERCRRYGMVGLDGSQVDRDETGAPVVVDLLTHAYLPTEKHIENIIRTYGEDHQQTRMWSVRDSSDRLFGRIKGGKLAGADAMNAIASEFWEWCAKGDFSPVLPRGREGGRATIGEAPTKRRNVSITDEDWEYLRLIGSSASDGIRVAIEAHRGGETHYGRPGVTW
ncbi:MAG: hypothetical protein R3A44_44280 [Caldilineaceae bacterium]